MPKPKSRPPYTLDNADLNYNASTANKEISLNFIKQWRVNLDPEVEYKDEKGRFLNHQEGNKSLHVSFEAGDPNFTNHQIKLDPEEDEPKDDETKQKDKPKISVLGLSKECRNLIHFLKKDQDTVANSLVFLFIKQKELTQLIEKKHSLITEEIAKEKQTELEMELKSLQDELSQLEIKINNEKEKKIREKEKIKDLELVEKNALEEFKQGKRADAEIQKITKEIDPIILRLFFVQEYIGYATEEQKIIRRTQANNLSIITRLLESNNNNQKETEFLLKLCNSLSKSTQDDLDYLIMQITNRNFQKKTEIKAQPFLSRTASYLTDYFFTSLSIKIKNHPILSVDQKVIVERKRQEQKEFLDVLLVKSKAALNKQYWLKKGDDCIKELQREAISESIGSFDNIDITIIDDRFSLYCPLNKKPIIIRSINDILTYVVEGIKNIQSKPRTNESLKNQKNTPIRDQKKGKLNPIEQVAFIYREAELGRRDLITYIDKCLEADSSFDNFIGQYQHYFQRVEKYRKDYQSTENKELKIEYIDLNKINIPRFIFFHNEKGLEVLKKLKKFGIKKGGETISNK